MRPLGIEPYKRLNWSSLNAGQRRYAMWQHNLARQRRGLPLDPYKDWPGGNDPQDIRNHFTRAQQSIESSTNQEAESELQQTDYSTTPRPGPSGEYTARPLHPITEALFNHGEQEKETPSNTRELTDSQLQTEFNNIISTIDPNRTDTMPDSLPGAAMEIDGHLRKRPRHDETVPAASESPTQAGHSGGGGVSGESDDLAGYVIPRTRFSQGTFVRKFHKTHKFLCYGVAPVMLKSTAGGGSTFFLTTPLMRIPVQNPQLYLSFNEFNRLFTGEECIGVEVKVIQRNVRVAFETNNTTSSLATLNQNKNGIVAIGLNKQHWFADGDVTFDATAPMVPTKFGTPTVNYGPMYYGTSVTGTVQTGIPCSFTGTPCIMNTYAAMSIWQEGPGATAPSRGWPDLTQHVHQYDAADFVGKEVCCYKYKPKYGALRTHPQFLYYGAAPQNQTIPMGQHQSESQAITLGNLGPPVGRSWQVAGVTSFSGIVGNTPWNGNIEKSQYLRMVDTAHDGDSRAHMQPSLHVGVMPVPSMTTTTNNTGVPSNWTDVQGYFDVECTMITKFHWRNEYAAVNTTGASDFAESQCPISTADAATVLASSATRLGLLTDQIANYMP